MTKQLNKHLCMATMVMGITLFNSAMAVEVHKDRKGDTLAIGITTADSDREHAPFSPLPPHNPYTGPSGTSTMHGNSASSDSTYNPGPGNGPVTINSQNLNAVFPTILMGSDGLLVAVGVHYLNQTPYVYLLDPDTLSVLATQKLVKSTTSDLAGGIYSYMDPQNRLVLVNAAGYLQRIAHTQQFDGTWTLTISESINIGYSTVVGLVPDYDGRIWFATAQGVSNGEGAVVGYYDPKTKKISVYTLPNGEQVANSISASPDGVAVASTSALYLFRAKNNIASQIWRQLYDQGPARKPGQLSWGTGATPTFFGPNTGFEYITITDNASPQENILVYKARSGKLIGSQPFLTARVNSGTEDSAIASGKSIFVPSTYGYNYPPSATTGPSEPASATFEGGMQRVDVLPNERGLVTVWMNQALASTTVPRLSIKDKLIYTVTIDQTTGVYSLVTINPDTGEVTNTTPLGSGDNYNTLQMVGNIAPTGILYQGTVNGLFSVKAD